MTINTNIGIIGCGWLGTALARSLLSDHVNVLATTTSSDKQNRLKNLGISSELLQLPDNHDELKNKKIFNQNQLVICITPQLKYGKKDYAIKINNLVLAANYNRVKHIILISTSAVYGNLTGNINEDAALDLSNEKVLALVNAEQALKNFSGSKTILRLTGLVGEDRHPGRFLAGKKELKNGNTAVNLIHQQDAVGIIRCLLTANIQAYKTTRSKNNIEIFNGTSNTHVSRQVFYQKAAQALNLIPAEFLPVTNKNNGASKIIEAKKIQDKHNYKFVYPDLCSWV